ncbi:hypothetical protein DFH06DRAFT_1485765 [Mycena polygramma]|nr:hypothetical protein DFH06DRAFT_1485765 [Mycena polygramma]
MSLRLYPSPPRLPADLNEPVIQELSDNRPALLSCSLVSQGWLPLARNHLTLLLTPPSIAEFLALLQSPTSFLLSTVRRLDISNRAPGPVHGPLLRMLPEFRRLRLLSMWCTFPDDLPPLPALTELVLCGEFPSYASFARFLWGVPNLRRLTLGDYFKCGDSLLPKVAFPSLELETASFECDKEFTATIFMWAPVTRRLTWGFADDDMSPEGLSRYLCRLGPRLQYLNLDFWTPEHIDRACEVDFNHTTGLQHLRLGDTVIFGYDSVSGLWEVNISPHLERLLSRITPYCRIQTLVFSVETDFGGASPHGPPWPSLARFAQLLDAAQLAAVREIEFVVDGDGLCWKGSARRAREQFELAIKGSLNVPGRTTRRVICTDGIDAREIHSDMSMLI